MNKQPFYHRVDGLLFTSTTGFSEDDFIRVFKWLAESRMGRFLGIVPDSLEVEEYFEPEPGDPADLM